MANPTRLKVANQATPYIRIDAVDDFPQHDVAHTASLATGLGSSVDFELHGDSNTTWSSANSVVVSTGSPVSLATSENGLQILQVKHSGYKEVLKTNATDATLQIFMDQTDATRYISLHPNESIIFHGPFGSNSDNANNWALAASDSNGLYAEVITCIGAND